MRTSIVGLLWVVAACASSGSAPESDIARPSERIVASDRQGVIRTTVTPNATYMIAAPPARVLAVIAPVYDALGIPSAAVDAANGRIAAPRFFRTRTLGDANLSMYFNCGDSLNGNIADTYRIYITVVTAVRSDGKGGTELETSATGEAANMGGASSGKIACGSTGRLEERIEEAVREKVGAPG